MRRFDLRPLIRVDTTWKRGRLVYALAVLVAWAVALGALLWSEQSLFSGTRWGMSSSGVDLALTLAIVGFLTFGLAGIPRLLPGAETLTVDGTGVHLTYRGATREDIPWAAGSGFVLRDYTGSPTSVRQGIAFSLHRPRYGSRRTLLTKEAFEAILTGARRQGVQISVRRGGATWRGPAPTVYRVRVRP